MDTLLIVALGIFCVLLTGVIVHMTDRITDLEEEVKKLKNEGKHG